MRPGARAREPFSWKASLGNARSALSAGDTTSGAKVLKALTDATQMAELCHELLFDLPAGEITGLSFEDWKEFLWTLYNDTRTYLKCLELIFPSNEGNLQSAIKAVGNAARHASVGMKYLNDRQPEEDMREAEMEKLDDLIVELEAAVDVLQPMSQVEAASEAPEGAEREELVWVPRLGRIAAGLPNLAQQTVESWYPLPQRLVGRGEHYLLEVSGDSMIDAGISAGDLLVVRVQAQAENGEIVVARTEDEEEVEGNALVKEFRVEDGHAWLVPHNPAFTVTPADTATIFGKVVTVLHVI